MTRYIKKTIQVFSLIFTFLMIFNVIRGSQLDSGDITEYLLVSFSAAAFSFVLYKEDYDSKGQFILFQLFYLGGVNVLILLFDFIFGWQLTGEQLLINATSVVVLFVFIRWILYRGDQKLADQINGSLEQLKEE